MQINRSAAGAVIATAATVLAGVAVGAPSLAAPSAGLPAASTNSALAQTSPTVDSVAGVSSAGGITVEVPRVAFGPDLTVSGGHLKAAVLLADPDVTGTASVLGADPTAGCAVPLVQGDVQFLDCTLPPGSTGPQTLAVTLSDGWQLVVSVP